MTDESEEARFLSVRDTADHLALSAASTCPADGGGLNAFGGEDVTRASIEELLAAGDYVEGEAIAVVRAEAAEGTAA